MKHPKAEYEPRFYLRIRAWMPEDRRSVKDFFFVSFSLSASFWLVVLCPWFIFLNESAIAWSTVISASVMMINFWAWSKGASLIWVHSIFQVCLISLITFNALHLGGVSSPAMIWLGIVPILPFFVVSRRWSYFWIFIIFIVVACLYFAQSNGLIQSKEPVSNALWASMIGLLTVTQTMLVITYDLANSKNMQNIKRKNEKLKNMADRLQMVNQEKDKFFATVSHELRTPLNVILGYLNLLNNNRELPPQILKQVNHALNSSSLLLTVVNDLLDYTAIKQGQLAFAPQNVQLKKVLFDAHAALSQKAEEGKLLYRLHLDDHLPNWVRLDPNRLTQIIFNLLNNAIKFTPSGFVELRANYVSNTHSSGHLHLQVLDSGVGIPLESQQSVFQPFVQLEHHHLAKNDDSLRGNGLGLSIVESLIRGWGGSIQLTSTPNEGTCFEVWLPIETAHAPNDFPEKSTEALAPQIFSEALKILIVDDHALNRMVAAATIHQSMPNVLIDEAKNGLEALNKMTHHVYDWVLMDIWMPDMTGTEVVRRIRTEASPSHRFVKVVALTANLSDAVKKECNDVGITDMLPKPLNRETLIQIIRSHDDKKSFFDPIHG